MAAGAGDRRAFELLVRRHKTPLYRLARRYVGNSDDAYDVVQEAFVSAWLALRQFDPQQSFAGWLRAITLNKCRDHGRRQAARHRILELLALEPVAATAPAENESDSGQDSLEVERQRLQWLDRSIAELPRRYKEPLLLVFVSGLTQQEAARELGISAKAVEMRLRRARSRLREILASAEPADHD